MRVEIQEADSTRLVVNQFDPASGTTVVNAIGPQDVERMVLVSDPQQPLWQVTVTGSGQGTAGPAAVRQAVSLSLRSIRTREAAHRSRHASPRA